LTRGWVQDFKKKTSTLKKVCGKKGLREKRTRREAGGGGAAAEWEKEKTHHRRKKLNEKKINKEVWGRDLYNRR